MNTTDTKPQSDKTVQELLAVGHERVYTETNWYDGPRSGVADVRGVPHYFVTDISAGASLDWYLVWPVEPAVLKSEKASYGMFVEWWRQFEAGEVGIDTHPLNSDADSPYNKLAAQLLAHRNPPANPCKIAAEWRMTRQPRHSADGPCYLMKWTER